MILQELPRELRRESFGLSPRESQISDRFLAGRLYWLILHLNKFERLGAEIR